MSRSMLISFIAFSICLEAISKRFPRSLRATSVLAAAGATGGGAVTVLMVRKAYHQIV